MGDLQRTSNTADAFLTSIGPADTIKARTSKYLETAGIPGTEHLETLIDGDIAGVLLPKPSITKEQEHVLASVNERSVGL